MAYAKKGRKPKGTKKELTVKWIVKDKKIIKFVEQEEKTYKLADNVLDFLDEIKSNVPVNVTIADDKVIFIQVNENAESSNEPDKSQEPKSEEKSESSNETYTVKAISKTRDYYLFDECGEKEWFTVAKNVKNFLKDVKKGDVLEIKHTVEKDDKGRDVRLINFAKVVGEKVEEKKENVLKTTVSTKKSSYRDEESTDKRTAVMTAKDIVVAYINSKAEIVNTETKVGELLKRLTKVCYEAIQSL